MRLGIAITVCGQHELSTVAIQHLLDNMTRSSTVVFVIDNGGDYECPIEDDRIILLRPEKNIGVYPVFKFAMERIDAEVVLFLHSDLIIDEVGFDVRLIEKFEQHSKLGLVGFVGSSEIDVHGGRGGGTTSNFQGKEYHYVKESSDFAPLTWIGSPARDHGRQWDGFTSAAVVDGCAMAVRRTAWDIIGFRDKFPPHHFYDRLISTQMIEAGFRVAVLGIACDHISGQTVGGKEYNSFAKLWCLKNLGQRPHPGDVNVEPNWDQMLYQEAERMWLREYRDTKHLVPIRVAPMPFSNA